MMGENKYSEKYWQLAGKYGKWLEKINIFEKYWEVTWKSGKYLEKINML